MPERRKADARTHYVTDFSKVASCRIHPGIGIARVGNSPDEYFIGPETPNEVYEGPFKDAQGRVKRQAARFRIFGYDEAGHVLGEIPIETTKDAYRRNKDSAHKARVVWTVHLANRKGHWHQFVERGQDPECVPLRNCEVEGEDRAQLIIDPGPRAINGAGIAARPKAGGPAAGGAKPTTVFDTGTFLGVKVPLGEIRTDRDGRLLVLGGSGKSGSTIEDNPIGADPENERYFANNDYWYDDVSDGRVTAHITLPGGDEKPIDDPIATAWVIVAPPKFAPGIYPIVTLYDVIRDVAVERSPHNGIGRLDDAVYYDRDIKPVLERAANLAWVNEVAWLGHGTGRRGDFRQEQHLGKAKTPPPDEELTKPKRERIFKKLRIPLGHEPPPDKKTQTEQATRRFMPPMSGDHGDAENGNPQNWLSVLPWQYRKFEVWASQDSPNPEAPAVPEGPAREVEDLQRAVLEPCAGGPFYPGIEMDYRSADSGTYCDAFRIHPTFQPGDITRNMAAPWQADFYACNTHWWPSQRPDDVVEEAVFDAANEDDSPNLEEELARRVDWTRGFGGTTLFRRPWNEPVDLPDETDDKGQRGCDDMVRYWHELGFVRPRTVGDKTVHVEMERRPYAGMPVRELFHALLNMDRTHEAALPKIHEFVELVLEATRRLQTLPSAATVLDNIKPFVYSEKAFVARMKEIYNDTLNFAHPYDPKKDATFKSRQDVIERIRQLTPFNLLDGSWLRNIHQLGVVDEVNAALFSIFKEELGDGIVSQNHANLYRDLCHSVGIYPPPVSSRAFCEDQDFLDAAFESPTFQLAISQFTREYYPELIGLTLYLEWTVVGLHRPAGLLEHFGINSHFYRMHIGIDNADSGHGARILRAVQIYLHQIAQEGGNVQEHWARIWTGYVSFSYTFSTLIAQIRKRVTTPLSVRARMIRMIQRKREYGQYNHRDKTLCGQSINSWFSDPDGLLDALVLSGHIIPGQPDESPFFQLLEFHGGPMYCVFTAAEIKLWREWAEKVTMPEDDEEEEQQQDAEGYGKRSEDGEDDEEPATTFDELVRREHEDHYPAASEAHVRQWLDQLASDLVPKPRPGETPSPDCRDRPPDKHECLLDAVAKDADEALAPVDAKYREWLAWSMLRILTDLARRADRAPTFMRSDERIRDPKTGEGGVIRDWLAAIRNDPNPLPVARRLLELLRDGSEADSAAWKAFHGSCALAKSVPGNDGRRAIVTIDEWICFGFPLPPPATSTRPQPLALENMFDEEGQHPFGMAIGFCRIS